MVGVALRSFKTTLNAKQVCLLSRLIHNNYQPRSEKELNLICISSNHSAGGLRIIGGIEHKSGSNRFYLPQSVTSIRWCTPHRDEEIILTRDSLQKDTFNIAYTGSGEDLTSYQAHLLYFRPELSPGDAVRYRITMGINKAIKSAASRKRQKELAFHAIRKWEPENILQHLMTDKLRKELQFIPQPVLLEGFRALKAELSAAGTACNA